MKQVNVIWDTIKKKYLYSITIINFTRDSLLSYLQGPQAAFEQSNQSNASGRNTKWLNQFVLPSKVILLN